jgi:hypothetical protein
LDDGLWLDGRHVEDIVAGRLFQRWLQHGVCLSVEAVSLIMDGHEKEASREMVLQADVRLAALTVTFAETLGR